MRLDERSDSRVFEAYCRCCFVLRPAKLIQSEMNIHLPMGDRWRIISLSFDEEMQGGKS